MSDLLNLAACVEAIDPTVEIDWTGIHSLNEAICQAVTGPGEPRTVIPPDYLRSLDAAMTLVPDGVARMIEQQLVLRDGAERAWVRISVTPVVNGSTFYELGRAATPALALCAAALRAKAAQ